MSRFDTKIIHPHNQITEIIDKIYRSGLTTASGGNISIMDETGSMWVTPSAIDKGSLHPNDIMCVKPDNTVSGPHKPSSEYPFHKAIYSCRPDIKAIIHAHTPALVAFSIVQMIPETNILPQAKKVCGDIGYADYEIPGSEALGEKIADQFKKGYNAVIMENHGTVVGGTDIIDAYQRFETLEFSARTIINGNILGKPKYLTDLQIDSFEDQVPHLMPEMPSVEHPADELAIREEIMEIVHRACNQELMISSYGTVSVRWRENDFLITPYNVPRWDLQIDDIVQIKGCTREPGKMPSRSTYLHYDIYKKHPHINSIILTQPPNLMAYSVTHSKFDVRTIPESWIFLQDVPNVPFGSHFAGRKIIPELISKNTPAVIINNDSIIITGDKLFNTYDRLEVAEFSAKSLVMGKALGTWIPIKNEQVEDLRKKFLS